MTAEKLRSSFGKCQVKDGNYVFPKDGVPYYKQYKTPCNFPADGFITEDTWTYRDVWSFEQIVTKKHISACGYHIYLFVEQREDED